MTSPPTTLGVYLLDVGAILFRTRHPVSGTVLRITALHSLGMASTTQNAVVINIHCSEYSGD